MAERWALRAMVVGGWRPEITPAPGRRDWMDATRDRFAYRCQPLNAANEQAWWLRLPCDVTIDWNGSPGLDGLEISTADPAHALVATSHFGHGIVTFTVPLLLRTPPGIHMLVKGPANLPVHGIGPLEGVVETDWAVATFTMNWQLTAPVRGLRLEAGFPYCELRPVPARLAAAAEPVIAAIDDDPELARAYREWSLGRRLFLEEQRVEDQRALGHTWEKDYFVEARRRARGDSGPGRVAPFAPQPVRPGAGPSAAALPARTFVRAIRVAVAGGAEGPLVDSLPRHAEVELPGEVASRLGLAAGPLAVHVFAARLAAAVAAGEYAAWSSAVDDLGDLRIPTGEEFVARVHELAWQGLPAEAGM